MARTPKLRHMRHRNYDRSDRSHRLNRFLGERATTLNATGATGTFTRSGNLITWTSHGQAVGDGPYLLTTTGTLPAGLSLNTLYWIVDVGASTAALATSPSGPPVVLTSAGSGVHTITRVASREAIFELLKLVKPVVLAAATDVDNL